MIRSRVGSYLAHTTHETKNDRANNYNRKLTIKIALAPSEMRRELQFNRERLQPAGNATRCS